MGRERNSKNVPGICGSTSDCHTTNGIKFLAGFASCIWLVMICVCLFQHDQITVDSVLNFTPKNPVLAVVVLLLFFALKSISIFFFAGILYAAAGILFPLPIAILVNILGTAIMVTIPYYIGKFAGTPLVNQILRRYPKAGLLKRIRAGNDFIFCFVARLIHVLPCDLVSMYMGAIQLDYGSYIWACLLGMLPPMITYPIMGINATDPHSSQFRTALCIELCLKVASVIACLFYSRAGRES